MDEHSHAFKTFRDRLEGFKSLKDGWLDNCGKAPSHSGLDWLMNLFREEYPDDWPQMYEFPTEDGGVIIEWTIGKYEAEVRFDIDNHTATWFYMEKGVKDFSEYEENIDVNNLFVILDKLRKLMGQDWIAI